jgi:D-alanine-D-alanine ligase
MVHVAILMGGWSSEREVSLRSGGACAKALEGSAYKVTTVDVGRDIKEKLKELAPDIALNMLHGGFGENGEMQMILEDLKIPYSHSGEKASELAMNKDRARDKFLKAGVPVAAGMTMSRFEVAKAHPMAMPYVVKPVADGSSVGVYIIHPDAEAPKAELAGTEWKYGDVVLVEKYIEGMELTCAVMGDRALDVIEIVSELPFYNYEAKYMPGGSKHVLPAPLPPQTYEQVQKIALQAHQTLGCRGISRTDLRYNEKNDELVCLEVNTQPGMTETSLVPEIAAYAGFSFPQLVDWMIKDASINR